MVAKIKLASNCLDGAKVIRGSNSAFHCVIHQQAVFSKEIGMNSTMNMAVKIINKIREMVLMR